MLFTFPSRYWSTIGRQVVFSLGQWSGQLPTGFLVSRGTWDPYPGSSLPFAYRTVTFFGEPFQTLRLESEFLTSRRTRESAQYGPTTPTSQRSRAYMKSVWAFPRSLAATEGIHVCFCSWRYLDVSVPSVRLHAPMYSVRDAPSSSERVSPFGHPRIKVC